MTFDSSLHPRGAGGKFAASGNSAAYGTSKKTKEQAANFKTLPDDKKKGKGKRKKGSKHGTAKHRAASRAARKQSATSKKAASARAHRLAGSTRKIRPLTAKQRKRLKAEATRTKLTTVRKRRIKAAARTQRLGRGGGFLTGSTVTRTVRDTRRVSTAGAVRAQRRLAADARLRRRGTRRYGR